MPFSKNALRDPLQTLFADPPDTAVVCAQGWANAVDAYFVGLTPPLLTAPQQLAAKLAAKVVLQGLLTNVFTASRLREQTALQMEAAFRSYALSIGAAMALLPLYTPTPPPAEIGFVGLFTAQQNATHADAADAYASAIHTWAKTGTAILNAPPATVLPWG